jgi:hypothetical protein
MCCVVRVEEDEVLYFSVVTSQFVDSRIRSPALDTKSSNQAPMKGCGSRAMPPNVPDGELWAQAVFIG